MCHELKVALCILLAVSFPAPGLSQARTFEISYSLASQQVSAHEPVILRFTVRNNLDQEATMDLGWQGVQNFNFTLTRPDGKQIKLRPPLKEGFAPSGHIVVPPGQSYGKQLVLSDWFAFDMPGHYQIIASLAAPVSGHGQEILAIVSGSELVLNVGVHDEQKLRKVCEDLADKISSAKSYEEAENAAKALGAINDPIAVPYLAKATTSWRLEPITIRALGKIRDKTAVEALVSLLASAEHDQTSLARSALMQIETETTDASLKGRIQQALQSMDARN